MNREPLSDADINAGKDFGNLMQAYKAAQPPFFKTPKFWFGASAVVVATVAAVLVYTKVLQPDTLPSAPDATTAFVNPPMPEADIKRDVYVLDTERDTTLTHSTGTKLRIPAHAFKDAAGNVVKGKVELHYREFHDVVDVILAGIPMTYDSAGQRYHFETAGMMEISATQNGKALFTNADAPIQVNIASRDSRDVFNSYYLDTAKREWQYIATANYTDKVAANGTIADGMALSDLAKGRKLFESSCNPCHSPMYDGTGPALKGAVARWDATPNFKGKTGREWLYSWIKNYNDGVNAKHPYSVAMSDSRPSAQNLYAGLTDEDCKNIMAYVETEDSGYARDFSMVDAQVIAYASERSRDSISRQIAVLRTKFDNVKAEIKVLETKKPVEPKKIDKSKPRFSIKVDEKEFPEIALYKGMKFQVVDISKYDEKKAKVMWDDISMKRIPNSLNYEITFSNTTANYVIEATPVFDTKEYAEAKKLYNEKFEAYESALATKKAEEAKLKADIEKRANEVRAAMQKEIEAQQQRQREYEASLTQTNLIYRTFTINGFGIYNCDRPQVYPSGSNCNVQYADGQSKELLHTTTVYLVEKGRNAVFTFSGDEGHKLKFNPAKENLIWVIDAHGRNAIIKPGDFDLATKGNKEAVLNMEVLNGQFKSAEEIKAYLQI